MQTLDHPPVHVEPLTDGSGHYFFGYYDLQPWSADSRYHLCHRVPFMDRLPTADDRAEIGLVEVATKRFVPLAETTAWNFQQGAMLQWNPCRPNDEILYNIHDADGFGAELLDRRSGARRRLGRPLASVAADGSKALSINFSRLLDFRPGYGYAGIVDPFLMEPAPATDGVFLLDLQTGEEQLVLSLATIGDLFAEHFGANFQGAKVLINHLTFNPAADRFFFLARTMAMPGIQAKGWMTLMGSADANGTNLHVFSNFGGASHYWWRDDHHILIYADLPGRGCMRLCLVEDRSQRFTVLDPDFFSFDGHCSYSPDQDLILYDSYPDAEDYRNLYIYDLERRQPTLLARLFSVPTTSQDARCDLHPRWHRNGTALSFDSTHDGTRQIFTMDLSDLV